MNRRPSFQFYPDNWQGNSNLLRCSHEEKGVWIDTLCLMHDSPTEYGILRWPLKEIAQAVHCKVSILQSLAVKGVLKGADPGEMCAAFTYTPRSGHVDGPEVSLVPSQPGPLWYSSRMVRDEYKRQHSGGSTRFKKNQDGDTDTPPSPSRGHGERHGDNQGERQGDGSLSLSLSPSPSVDSLLRSNPENLVQGEAITSLRVDPVILALPCQKGKHYHVTQATLDRWKDAYPELDLLAEAKKMRLWLEENPTRQKSFSSMGRFVTNWLGSSRERAKAAKQPTSPQKARSAEMAEYLAANPGVFGDDDDISA